MRYIDLQSWPRRQHFEFFRAYDYPHVGMCANVDLTALYRVAKERGYSVTVAIVWVIAKAANAVPEFRYRIRGDQVVELEVVHPGFTILADEDRFSFCTADYSDDFPTFAAKAAEQIAYVREHPFVHALPRDDLLYMTAIPWVSFTSFLHPLDLHPADSIPRFAWGKFFQEGDALKMPLGVQGHHALVDGIHIGRLYASVEDSLQRAEVALGEG